MEDWIAWGPEIRKIEPGNDVEFMFQNPEEIIRVTVIASPDESQSCNCMTFADGNMAILLDPTVGATHKSPPVYPTPEWWKKV